MKSVSVPPSPRDSPKTVLVVEDDPDSREVFTELLRGAGMDVVAAANGAEALSYLRAHRAPSVIILDMLMPEMDGWQFRRAQSGDPELRGIPVIVVSALRTVESSAMRFGAAAFLGKPFSPEALLHAVARIA